MNIRIISDFQFSICSVSYANNGEICVKISSSCSQPDNRCQYSAVVSDGRIEARRAVSLLEYARRHEQRTDIKVKTQLSYRLMCDHLEKYGDANMDNITTEYLEGFITYLQDKGLAAGTVRLHFQKLSCVLHEAYREELFDERILLRAKRPKREQEKRCFLTEAELRRMSKRDLPEEYANIRSMFLFSSLTGLRFSDIQGLKWKDVKRNGNHLYIEFKQHKTDTVERLPLSPEAEALLRGKEKKGEYVFGRESNQHTNSVLKRWKSEARIKKDVTFHCARHTFCVLLLTKDVPIYTVQRLMCHSDIGTTKIYADLTCRAKSKALRKLPVINVSA